MEEEEEEEEEEEKRAQGRTCTSDAPDFTRDILRRNVGDNKGFRVVILGIPVVGGGDELGQLALVERGLARAVDVCAGGGGDAQPRCNP